jgi:hypothetical protein
MFSHHQATVKVLASVLPFPWFDHVSSIHILIVFSTMNSERDLMVSVHMHISQNCIPIIPRIKRKQGNFSCIR